MFAPKQYHVYKFNFAFLLQNDFNINGSREELLKHRITQQDNMLFRQIRLISNENGKFNKYVIFVDIHGSKSKIEELETLVENGIMLNGTHYELCERSPSMSRNAILSFVSDEVFEQLDAAITMDIQDTGVLSKYMGYRGLMFSSCHCFEGWLPKIIVVPDGFATIKDQYIKYVYDEEKPFIDRDTGEERTWTQKAIKEGVRDVSINLFDGCGLHHPEISLQVQELLGTENATTSITWRAPFIKGVTHDFDYPTFYRERGITHIKDIWGVEHSIDDVMLILTESMYKGFKYFKTTDSAKDWGNYWEVFHKYNHCIGVAKWNFSKAEEPIYTRANYQVLQDLELEYNDFASLSDYTIDWLVKVSGEDIRYTLCFLGMMADMRNPQTDYVNAILRNPEMVKEKGVREYIVNQLKKYIDDAKCGKLYLKSTFKIFVPDLVALAEHVGGLEINGCLEADEFYSNDLNGSMLGERLIERNPHICKSEHTILNGVENDLLIKYCSHLSNICMTNCKSLTPQRLNGAD